MNVALWTVEVLLWTVSDQCSCLARLIALSATAMVGRKSIEGSVIAFGIVLAVHSQTSPPHDVLICGVVATVILSCPMPV